MNLLCPASPRFIVKAVLLTFTILSSTAHAASPFTTEGKFSVGSDGSANYSIPIVVPPGTAGMQPQLALNYNSNGGNGIVGMGWGIDGLSQISRCGTTLEQDGVINGVTYTAKDRFCIDGQRLIATTDSYVTNPADSTKKIYSTTSAYGANGTEYRTESANFAKVISYGTAGTGPAYFKVWTKSGQIIEYGNTADSAIEAQGKPTIRTWGVNKISDTKGNYITVSYTEDNANGEAYVSRIDYTGNVNSTPALTPYANVQFVYEARPDTTIGYQAGSVLKTTKRLTNIQTFNGTTQVKSYKLAYEQSQATQRSRVKTVQECDGMSATYICKTPITIAPVVTSFMFQNSQSLWTDFFGSSTTNGGFSNTAIWPKGIEDINGDGLPDVYAFDSNGVKVGLNTGTGFAAWTLWANYFGTNDGFNDVSKWPKGLADINGDGLPDVYAFDGNGVKVGLNTGTGFAAWTLWANYFGTNDGFNDVSKWPKGLADINGDGLLDVYAFDGNGVKVLLNMGVQPKLISKIITSNITFMIDFKSLINAALYQKDRSALYPFQDVHGPLYVVSSATVSDGSGGVVTTNYQYGGLKAHLRGRGSLGFRYVTESSPDSGLSVTTFYRQDFPFIGLPSQVEKRRLSDNALLSMVQNTYANTDLATGTMLSKFPYLSQSVEQAYELDGSLVSTTTTTNQYDGYGNATSVKVDDGLGNTKTTTSTYKNDVGNWLLGRLIRSTVTSVIP